MPVKINAALLRLIVTSIFSAGIFLLAIPAFAEDKLLSPPSLEKIAENVWVHKSYKHIEPWGPVLSQGIVVETGAGVFLVDTAWNDEDTDTLIDLIIEETGETPKVAIITHAHHDKMGGVAALNERSVPTIMHHWTMLDAPARGLDLSSLPQSAALFKDDETAHNPVRISLSTSTGEAPFYIMPADEAAQNSLIIHHPGPGHTRDNIVVYYEPAKTLFGGCFIRHAATKSIGNTEDADVSAWPQSARNVAEAFPEAEVVIPSHGPAAGIELIDHTIDIADKAAAQ